MPPKLQPVRAAAEPARPVVRAQSDDTAVPNIRIPTPEELGLGTPDADAANDSLDWTLVERKLDAAGATGYQVEKTTTGYKFTCQLPSGAVTGRGSSRPAAVRSALAQLAR